MGTHPLGWVATCALAVTLSACPGATASETPEYPSTEYRERYDRWRTTHAAGANLPDLRTRVVLLEGRITGTRAILIGFELDGVVVEDLHDGSLRLVPFARFAGLQSPGRRRVSSRELRLLCGAGEVPLLSPVAQASRDIPGVSTADSVASGASREWDPATAARHPPWRLDPMTPRRALALEAGPLWSGPTRVHGAPEQALLLRLGPASGSRAIGPGCTLGILRDEAGDVFVEFGMAVIGSVPLGAALSLQSSAGFEMLLPAVTCGTLGAGLTARAARTFGVRLDYERRFLIGRNLNYDALHSVTVGPFWDY